MKEYNQIETIINNAKVSVARSRFNYLLNECIYGKYKDLSEQTLIVIISGELFNSEMFNPIGYIELIMSFMEGKDYIDNEYAFVSKIAEYCISQRKTK